MAVINVSPAVYARLGKLLGRSGDSVACSVENIARLESELAAERDRLKALQEEKSLMDELLSPAVAEYERIHRGR